MFDDEIIESPATKESVIELHRTLHETNKILARIEKTLGWILGAAVFFVVRDLIK